jgi:hypothetical protein
VRVADARRDGTHARPGDEQVVTSISTQLARQRAERSVAARLDPTAEMAVADVHLAAQSLRSDLEAGRDQDCQGASDRFVVDEIHRGESKARARRPPSH